ncbi:MAG: moaE [Frankiales bacterium]|nr:moaE [Frankiales bacterium]
MAQDPSSTATDTAGKIRIAEVSASPLDVMAHIDAVGDPAAGAEVTFRGVVRDHDHGRGVTALEYDSHPSAGDVLRGIAAEVAADDNVIALAVSHRVGELKIGDVALVVTVSAAHRKQALDQASRLVEEVKARLPIWKRQVFADGTDEWVNCP